MPSPITTGGFQISERLNPQYLDPRLLTPNYGNIIPGLSQGLGAAGQFLQLADEAQARPLRRELQQLQIEDARSRAGLRPLETQRRRLELAQPIRTSLGNSIKRIAVPDELVPRLDEAGNPMLDAAGNPIMENVAGTGGTDVMLSERFREVSPLTGAQNIVDVDERPIQTMEQGRNTESLIDAREAAALAASERLRLTGERDAAKAENDRIKADAARVRAELLAQNPGVSYVDVKREDGRTIRQYFPKGEPGRIIHEIDRGELGAEDFLTTLMRQQPKTAGVPVAPTAAGDFQSRTNSILGRGPAVDVPAFSTVQEAEAAGRNGLLKPGTKITVGGKPATWH